MIASWCAGCCVCLQCIHFELAVSQCHTQGRSSRGGISSNCTRCGRLNEGSSGSLDILWFQHLVYSCTGRNSISSRRRPKGCVH
jgi:hypothetical protein